MRNIYTQNHINFNLCQAQIQDENHAKQIIFNSIYQYITFNAIQYRLTITDVYKDIKFKIFCKHKFLKINNKNIN